jgi:hypothetical protein
VIQEEKDGTLKLNLPGANTIHVTHKEQIAAIQSYVDKHLLSKGV